METVNFACGHCGNLMAVTTDLLGQAVRCPHCQKVVTAPAPAPVAAPQAPDTASEAPFVFHRVKEEESIFHRPKPHDDLFGDPKPAAVELPPGPPAAAPIDPAPTVMEDHPFPSQEFGSGPAFSSPAREEATNHPTAPDASDRTAVLPPVHDWSSPSASESAEESPAPEEAAAPARPARRAAEKGGSSPLLVFLVPYAIFITFVAGYLYFQSRQQKDPLEYLQDQPGENPGVTKKKVSLYNRISPDSDLSARLRVPLGKTIRIGALEVTPERVERGKLTFCYTNRRARDQSRDEALLLTLRLRNVSSDQVFYPTDPAFDALWERDKNKPYTYLEVGPNRFYGGALEWANGRPSGEYIQGQEQDSKPLGPGEERTTVITTNPKDPAVVNAVQRHKGPLLWRVRLRRGLVAVRDREISASSVIGVDFSPGDIRRKS